MPTVSKCSSKARQQRNHFSRRCKERLGINIDSKIIAKQIQNNKLKFFKRKSNRVTVWEYVYDNEVYLVFYDTIRSTPITIYKKYEKNPLITNINKKGNVDE